MVKPPIVWGTLSFREEGRPDQKKIQSDTDDKASKTVQFSRPNKL
jgi:hypothetical protein